MSDPLQNILDSHKVSFQRLKNEKNILEKQIIILETEMIGHKIKIDFFKEKIRLKLLRDGDK